MKWPIVHELRRIAIALETMASITPEPLGDGPAEVESLDYVDPERIAKMELADQMGELERLQRIERENEQAGRPDTYVPSDEGESD